MTVKISLITLLLLVTVAAGLTYAQDPILTSPTNWAQLTYQKVTITGGGPPCGTGVFPCVGPTVYQHFAFNIDPGTGHMRVQCSYIAFGLEDACHIQTGPGFDVYELHTQNTGNERIMIRATQCNTAQWTDPSNPCPGGGIVREYSYLLPYIPVSQFRVQLTPVVPDVPIEEDHIDDDDGVATNLALNKPADQSSTLQGWGGNPGASAAVDGNTQGDYYGAGGVTHTWGDPYAWWQVDLGASYIIDTVNVWNRTDCCGDRLSNYWVFISDTPFGPTDTVDSLKSRALTYSLHLTAQPSPMTAVPAYHATGRYVRVQSSNTDSYYLSLAEVQVMGWAIP